MKPIFQTYFDKEKGDCFSASIASILEIPLEQVPNFSYEFKDNWDKAANEWLKSRGLKFLTIAFHEYKLFCDTFFDYPNEYCIISGPSTYKNRSHAVVGKVTEQGNIDIVHNPIPNGQELPLGLGYRWVRFIVSL